MEQNENFPVYEANELFTCIISIFNLRNTVPTYYIYIDTIKWHRFYKKLKLLAINI